MLFDLAFGEPRNRWHPVAWVGRTLGRARHWAPSGRPMTLLAFGALVVVGSSLLVAALVAVVAHGAPALGWLGIFFQAWLLKCAFSLRGLVRAAGEVRTALSHGRLEEARSHVGRHLVSRPTSGLSADQVVSATVESVAENLTDSVVAPLFFFLLFGLPGAWAYRVVNTADAMWGYRGGDLEHLGKAAARLDDLLNWIPARLAGVGIVLGAFLVGEAAGRSWHSMWRDHVRTASPNAGWTIAAMAGALGVGLEKPGAYKVGGSCLPTAECIDRAVRIMGSASGVALALALALGVLRP
ncbi:MAG: adenosylcobinamide-phosphate synthase CbiB [Candidatus Methylomirabilia bacterium]